MSTNEKWTRNNKKWSDEIIEWVRARCPAPEHGYADREQMLKELNEKFDRDFSIRGFASHCYECGISLGFMKFGDVRRSDKHWRYRKVGELQIKKDYVRIKVAEPNVWMQYQRFIWEQHHPGESAEGKRVIFMDGNNRNFDPDNLECITPAEQSIMAALGCKASSTREEREIYLLRARIAHEKNAMIGDDRKALKLHQKIKHEQRKNDPAYKAGRAEYYQRRKKLLQENPELMAKQKERWQKYRDTHKEERHEWYIRWKQAKAQ